MRLTTKQLVRMIRESISNQPSAVQRYQNFVQIEDDLNKLSDLIKIAKKAKTFDYTGIHRISQLLAQAVEVAEYLENDE